MHRLRFLVLLGLMFAVGGAVACRAQTNGQDQSSTQSQKVTHKNKKVKNASSYKRHWYSPASWFHKKHGSEAKNAKPASKHMASASYKRHWYSPASWFHRKHSSEAKNRKPANQHVASSQPAAAAASNSNPAAASASPKTATGTKTASATSKPATASKGTAKAGCTPEQAKKTGCTVDKNHTQKGTTSSAAAGANPS
jgi:hypothetical protein